MRELRRVRMQRAHPGTKQRTGCTIGPERPSREWSDGSVRPQSEIVLAEGSSPDRQRWIPSRPGCLVPVSALSGLFRGKLLDGLRRRRKIGTLKLSSALALLNLASVGTPGSAVSTPSPGWSTASHPSSGRTMGSPISPVSPTAWTRPSAETENWQDRLRRLTGLDVTLCPHCRMGKLFLLATLPPSCSPPKRSIPA